MNIKDAVRKGELESVVHLINSVGISNCEGYSLLCDAIENNHTEIIKFLLTNITEVNGERKKHTNTPLHFAAENGDIEIIQMLLDKGAIVDAKNEQYRTALHIAVEHGRIDISELLINRLANVNSRDNNHATPLCLAAEKGYLEIVEQLLTHGAYVNTVYSCDIKEYYRYYKVSGVTPLHIAVQNEHYKIVEKLLKHNAHVNSEFTSESKKHYTPLHLAVQTNNVEITSLLLKYGANVNAEGKDSITPLHIAGQESDEKVVELLLENGANVDATNTASETALYFAVEHGLLSVVQTMLKYHPDVNNKSNRNSIICALYNQSKERQRILESLLEYGFTIIPEDIKFDVLVASIEIGCLKIFEQVLNYDINIFKYYSSKHSEGSTLLHVAAAREQLQIAKLLLNHGADVNAIDFEQLSPIYYATVNMDLKIIELLISSGANIKDYPDLLNIAVEKTCTKVVEIFLQHGVDANTADKHGRSALHFTAVNEYGMSFLPKHKHLHILDERAKIAKLLLRRGADVNATDITGSTALHAAAKTGFTPIVCILLENNADVNARNGKEETALHISIQNGHKEVAQMLLTYGAGIDIQDKEENTPLHIAARKGHLEILEILLSFGADIDRQNSTGKTPLHLACSEKHEKIVVTLLEYGSDINVIDKNNDTPLHLSPGAFANPQLKVYVEFQPDDFNIYVNTAYSGKEITDILQQHIIKLTVADLFVSENNFTALTMDNKLRKFKTDCESEMKLMTKENVSYHISIKDILTGNLNLLNIYARNEDTIQLFKSKDFKMRYPIYADWIINNIRKGIVRQNLLENGIKSFSALFKSFPELPYCCAEKILCFLSNNELRRLTCACKIISGDNCLRTDNEPSKSMDKL